MKIVFYLLIGLILLSCSKNNSGSPTQKKLLLKKVYHEDHLQSEYKYYEDDRLKSEILYNTVEETVIYTISYEYSGDTTLQSSYNENNELVFFRKMVYNKKALKREWYDSENQLIGYMVYINNNDACGFSQIIFYNADGSLNNRYVYEYIDSNCSIKKSEYNSENQLEYVYENEMDGKNYYFNSNNTSYFFQIGNTINGTRRDPLALNKYATYKSTIEYNSDDYPISNYTVYTFGPIYTEKYEYY
jgi:hypothetical protein